MRSRFSFWAYFLAFYAIIISCLLLLCLLGGIFYTSIVPLYFYMIITLGILFVWCWVVFGELRTKIIRIEIGYDTITIKRFLGLGPSQLFYFDKIDGFKISLLTSRANVYEYLYLVSGDKKIAKLSQYYHKNYQELKAMLIAENVKDLGFEEYRYITELKEIFT